MKPVFMQKMRVFATQGGTPVAVVGASIRIAPDEGLILWGYGPRLNFGAYRVVGNGVVKNLPVGWVYRPAYRKVVVVCQHWMYAVWAGVQIGREVFHRCEGLPSRQSRPGFDEDVIFVDSWRQTLHSVRVALHRAVRALGGGLVQLGYRLKNV